MVDLAKIRKKAKAVGRGPGVGGRESEQAAVPVPVPNPEVVVVSEPSPDSTPDSRPPTPGALKLEQFKQIAGKRRQGFIEQKVEVAAVEQMEMLSFIIGGEQYAVSIDHLVEIVTPRETTRVPNADPTIVGIISLRGAIVTIIDVRRKLRHAPAPADGDETRIIVARCGAETLGFEVDRVLRVLKVEMAAIEPHPVVHSSELSEAVRGVFRHANALTILLDLDKLLA